LEGDPNAAVAHEVDVGANELPTEYDYRALKYLVNELHRLDAVTDSLIVWALAGTDPEHLMTRSEVFDRIVTEVPSARHIVNQTLDGRLEGLATKPTQPDASCGGI
jgi:hypothetical protein